MPDAQRYDDTSCHNAEKYHWHCFIPGTTAEAVVSPSNLNSDLSILIQNDLLGIIASPDYLSLHKLALTMQSIQVPGPNQESYS